MTERDPFTELQSLARYGEDGATVPPVEHVRAWGARRRRRRHAAVAAVVLAGAVLSGGAVLSQTRIFTDTVPDPAKTPVVSVIASPSRPTPSDSPTSSAPPTPDPTSSLPAASPPLGEVNLPAEFDLEFREPYDWSVRSTTAGVGADPVSRCVTEDVQNLQPVATFSRTYNSFTDGSAAALVLELGEENKASTAYDTLISWFDDCAAALTSQGYARVDVAKEWDKVTVENGKARTTLITSAQLGQADADVGLFEEIGLTRVGTRIAVVSFLTPGQDYNFASKPDDPTGLPLYPMMRSLPKVADRLGGHPRTPSKPHRLSTSMLLDAPQVPVQSDHDQVVATDSGLGRRPEALSVCQAGQSLNASQELSRNFRQQRSDTPADADPSIYTNTLQFASAARAEAAGATLDGWLRGCRSTLLKSDHTVLEPADGQSVTTHQVEQGDDIGAIYDLAYVDPGGDPENVTFENVGVLVVEDRLLLMVRVNRGPDDNAYYYETKLDGRQRHPFYAMMASAEKKLVS